MSVSRQFAGSTPAYSPPSSALRAHLLRAHRPQPGQQPLPPELLSTLKPVHANPGHSTFPLPPIDTAWTAPQSQLPPPAGRVQFGSEPSRAGQSAPAGPQLTPSSSPPLGWDAPNQPRPSCFYQAPSAKMPAVSDSSPREFVPRKRGSSGESPPPAPGATPGVAKSRRMAVCAECGKGFERPSALRVRERSHSHEQPFVCQVTACGKQFSTAGNFKRHQIALMHSPAPAAAHTHTGTHTRLPSPGSTRTPLRHKLEPVMETCDPSSPSPACGSFDRLQPVEYWYPSPAAEFGCGPSAASSSQAVPSGLTMAAPEQALPAGLSAGGVGSGSFAS